MNCWYSSRITRCGVNLTKPTVCAAAPRIDCAAAMYCARSLGVHAEAGTDRSRSFHRPVPLLASSLLIPVHAVQLGSSVITAIGPVSLALATPAAESGAEPRSERGPLGAPEPPPPKSNTTATTVARTATTPTAPMAHLRFLLLVGPSDSDVTMVQLK